MSDGFEHSEELAPADRRPLAAEENKLAVGLRTLSQPSPQGLNFIVGERLPIANRALSPLATDVSGVQVDVFNRNVAYF